jgi:hypothetical protein
LRWSLIGPNGRALPSRRLRLSGASSEGG